MKQLNIWKTSFYTMLAIASGAFTACVDDDVDKQAPTLELSEEAVAFTGTATEDATVTVRSNRQWTVAYEDEETQKEWMYFKVSGNEVSEGIYNGDGTVKITVGESAQPHMGRLIFTLSNSYGELYRKYLTVTQGNYVPPTVGAVGKLVEYILGNSDLSGAVGSDKAMPLQYSESTIEAVILANDAAGNNNRKLYVGDNNGLERSAIVLYGADFAMANDPVTKYPAGRKVTLNLENAKYYAFNNVRQLTDVVVTVGDEEVELVVPSLSVEKFNTGDYQAQYVKLNNMTPAQSFVGKPWTATESQSVTLNDASGKTLTVYMNKAQFATGFADMYVADKTGTIYGVAETYRENAQLIPTKKADIAALSTDQGGGTDPEPADPAHIVLDFSRGKDMATPAFPYHDKDDSSSATEGTYTIDGYTYHIKASADGKFYWFYNNYNAETKPETVYEAFFIGTTGAYIELPAISGKALSKVILTGASGASGDSEAAITDTAGADIAGGLSQVVGKGEATYDLSGTVANTSYRITVTKKNCQFAKIELFYGEGGGSTPVQPTLSVNPTSLSFAAKDQAKTIACTVANADGYTVGASSSDPANFAASAAGTTVTVTPTENTGSARNATVTVYLTNDGGATKVAAKTVAVTQAAAGGQPTEGGYTKITKSADIVDGMSGFLGAHAIKTNDTPPTDYGLQLVTGFATYGVGYTTEYIYDETSKELSLKDSENKYVAQEFTFEATTGGFHIKQGDKYLIGTGIIDNKKVKQGLALADAPAQPWVFTDDAEGMIATTSASGEIDGQSFNYPQIYMLCATTAKSNFIRAYVDSSYGKGFWFFKKN
ncbi:DUF5689 domain-containing protein [Alistipes communis]|uniref:DUF5689 domain-containing protein n=1 Tax=Alistipes communis TaxID=2585118 RepID=UPI00189C1699|nr:DUF5689 domain-containing protein [Alistipes communis]